MIKSFRGLLADEDQKTIRLSTNDGLTGYRIKKLDIFPEFPGTVGDKENVIQLWSVKQTDLTVTSVNFENSLLLGVAYFTENSAAGVVNSPAIVIFDNVTINQDIFVTHIDVTGTTSCNYYLELEQVKLDVNEATVATLKDMRASE